MRTSRGSGPVVWISVTVFGILVVGVIAILWNYCETYPNTKETKSRRRNIRALEGTIRTDRGVQADMRGTVEKVGAETRAHIIIERRKSRSEIIDERYRKGLDAFFQGGGYEALMRRADEEARKAERQGKRVKSVGVFSDGGKITTEITTDDDNGGRRAISRHNMKKSQPPTIVLPPLYYKDYGKSEADDEEEEKALKRRRAVERLKTLRKKSMRRQVFRIGTGIRSRTKSGQEKMKQKAKDEVKTSVDKANAEIRRRARR